MALAAPGWIRRVCQRHGYVFDKWPPPGVGHPIDRIAEYDAETRWQGLAFSMYTELIDMQQKAEREPPVSVLMEAWAEDTYKVAEQCRNYEWSELPEERREKYREHVRRIADRALAAWVPGPPV